MDDDKISEQFNQKRMARCTEVYRTIFNHSSERRRFECRVVADERVDGRSLEELGKMYFDVGAGDTLTTLPFLDMLIVFQMIADQWNKRTEKEGTKENWKETFAVKTEFTEDEVFAVLQDICQKIGIEVRGG